MEPLAEHGVDDASAEVLSPLSARGMSDGMGWHSEDEIHLSDARPVQGGASQAPASVPRLSLLEFESKRVVERYRTKDDGDGSNFDAEDGSDGLNSRDDSVTEGDSRPITARSRTSSHDGATSREGSRDSRRTHPDDVLPDGGQLSARSFGLDKERQPLSARGLYGGSSDAGGSDVSAESGALSSGRTNSGEASRGPYLPQCSPRFLSPRMASPRGAGRGLGGAGGFGSARPSPRVHSVTSAGPRSILSPRCGPGALVHSQSGNDQLSGPWGVGGSYMVSPRQRQHKDLDNAARRVAQLEELLQKAQQDNAQLQARLVEASSRGSSASASAMDKKAACGERMSGVDRGMPAGMADIGVLVDQDQDRSPDAEKMASQDAGLKDVERKSKVGEASGHSQGHGEAEARARQALLSRDEDGVEAARARAGGEDSVEAGGEQEAIARATSAVGDAAADPSAPRANATGDANDEGKDGMPEMTATSACWQAAAADAHGPSAPSAVLPWSRSVEDGHRFARKWEIAADELHKVRCIGRGAAGAVYEGRWNGGPVAIKQLDLELSEIQGGNDPMHMQHDPKQAEVLLSFRHEVSRMAFLRHPNVVAFFGIVWQPPSLAIVTELAQGDMRGFINALACSSSGAGQGGLTSLTRRVKAGREACAGLLYLHEQSPPIVHRDVKPENFLVGAGGEIKVCDLGLARDLPDHQTRVHTEHMGGSSIYIAPEVHQGQRFDTGCDVYAMALVSWELLSLQRPFHEFPEHMLPGLVGWGAQRPSLASLLELAEARKDGPEGAALPPLLRAIESAWAQDPRARPRLGELFAALEVALRVLEDGNLLRKKPAGEEASTNSGVRAPGGGGGGGAPGAGLHGHASNQVRVMF